VRLLPDVGPQGVVERLASEQSIEDILPADEDVEVIAMGTADERHEIGSAVARRDTPDEHPVVSAQGYLLHQLLGLVVVEWHQAIVEIDEQVRELIPQVGQCPPKEPADRFGRVAHSIANAAVPHEGVSRQFGMKR
jgi:hypothetical protein